MDPLIEHLYEIEHHFKVLLIAKIIVLTVFIFTTTDLVLDLIEKCIDVEEEEHPKKGKGGGLISILWNGLIYLAV